MLILQSLVCKYYDFFEVLFMLSDLSDTCGQHIIERWNDVPAMSLAVVYKNAAIVENNVRTKKPYKTMSR